MSPCESHIHPQVPVTIVTLSAVYCHQCMAWRLMFGTQTQQDDVVFTRTWEDVIEYGPFDDVGLVLDDACSALARELTSPGRPWDTRSWGPPDSPSSGVL